MSDMTFNSVTGASYGLTHCSPRIPLLPIKRRTTIVIPGRDGVWDYNTNSYEPRIIPVDCYIASATEAALKTSLNSIAIWLSSQGYLIFDHDATKQWNAKLYEITDQEFIPMASKFVALMECYPYAEDVTATNGVIDSAQDYGSDIAFYPTITLTMTHAATSATVTLSSTGEYVTYTDTIANEDVIVFNMSTRKVTNNATSVMDKVSIASQFFDVPIGSQTINSSFTGDGTATAVITYRKRYLYA